MHDVKTFSGALDDGVILRIGFEQVENQQGAVRIGLASLYRLQGFAIGIDMMNTSKGFVYPADNSLSSGPLSCGGDTQRR